MHPALLTAMTGALFALAADAGAKDQSSSWIRVPSSQSRATVSSHSNAANMAGVGGAPAGEGWIEIRGWDWEVEAPDNLNSLKADQGSTGSVDAQANKVGVVTIPPNTSSGGLYGTSDLAQRSYEKSGGEWIADVERPREKARRPIGTSDLTMKRGTSPGGHSTTVNQYAIIQGQAQATPTPPPPPPPRRPPDMNYIEGDTGTHEAPVPPDKFGRVKVRFAWDSCARGSRLSLVELRDERNFYRLEDVTVVDCSAGGATLRYARLTRASPM
ncbi:MAG TPA: hypothetical protein VNJ05_05955 [Sphingomicrobium sp.]|nr:hypothetical protein [Sphingomicrobium sp.]